MELKLPRWTVIEVLALATAIIGTASIATSTWYYAGIDMYDSYLPWFKHIRQLGPVKAFSAPFGSYTPPYLYMLALATPIASISTSFTAVKIVSYAGHVALALATRRLAAIVGCSHSWLAAALILIAPSLLISPAVLVQCDSYWAAALVMALAAAIRLRPATMFFWCGLAVGIKLQAAFAGPLFLALALAQRMPPKAWLAAPVGYFVTILPAWLSGWPMVDLLTIYWTQVGFSDRLSLAAPNVWSLVQALPILVPRQVGTVGTVLAVAASGWYVCVFAKRLHKADGVEILRAACLCALMVPGLLPRMHERYFFFADVIVIALAVVRPRWWPVAILVQVGSFTAIWTYLTGLEQLLPTAALTMIVATWLVLRTRPLPTTNGLELPTAGVAFAG